MSAWIDGETDPRLSDRIEKHLAVCPGCGCVLREAQSVKNLFRQSAAPSLPEGFAPAVMREVRLFAAKRAAAFQLVVWWRDLTLPLRVATAVTFLLVLSPGSYMGETLSGENPQAARTSSTAAPGAVVASMVQPFGETGAETLADAYPALRTADERGR